MFNATVYKLSKLAERHRWKMVAGVTLMVFGLSSIPSVSLPPLPNWDKGVHLLEYLGVGLIYLNAFAPNYSRFSVRVAVYTLLAVALLAGLDEAYQGIIPGRVTDWRDFVADLTGGMLALIMGFAHWRFWTVSGRNSSLSGDKPA